MELRITVPDESKGALEERARECGCSDVATYIQHLISVDLLSAKSFDDILAPIRKAFQTIGMTPEEGDALFTAAREEVSQEQKASKG